MRWRMKCSSPRLQSINRSFTRKEATIIRVRLCSHPVWVSWRIPASTIGYPVRPSHQAKKSLSLTAHEMLLNSGLKAVSITCGK